MLYIIKTANDPYAHYLRDDPVRPEIPPEFRMQNNRFVIALVDADQPTAIICISLHDFVPGCVEELQQTSQTPKICVAYSIWSYRAGSGRELLMSTITETKRIFSSIERMVTLSPKTDIARKFHLNNGAFILRENSTTINYEYLINF